MGRLRHLKATFARIARSIRFRLALWFVAIMLLGNIAMAVYMLILLFRAPTSSRMEDLLLRKS